MITEFDLTKLSTKERELFEKLPEKEKTKFINQWQKVEKQKTKLQAAKNEMRRLEYKQKTEERKARTRRLIQIGGIVEKYAPMTEDDLPAFENYIKQYQYAIKRAIGSTDEV